MSDFAVSAREATARSASSGGREPLTTMRWVSGGPWSTAVVSEVRRWPPVADRPRANRRRRSRTRSWGCSPGPRPRSHQGQDHARRERCLRRAPRHAGSASCKSRSAGKSSGWPGAG